jgi:hypothetical protein
LEAIAAPDAEGRKLLTDAAERMRLTARGYHRVLRVARPLADLEGAASVRRIHIAEALAWRRASGGGVAGAATRGAFPGDNAPRCPIRGRDAAQRTIFRDRMNVVQLLEVSFEHDRAGDNGDASAPSARLDGNASIASTC